MDDTSGQIALSLAALNSRVASLMMVSQSRKGVNDMWQQMVKRMPVVGGIIATSLLVNLPEPAQACSCLPSTIESSYSNATDVVSVDIWLQLGLGGSRWYLGNVRDAYKGCNGAGELILIETASSSAACGATFNVGERYLIHGYADGDLLGIPRVRTGLCSYNVLEQALDEDEREFLASRMVCCGEECTCADGSDPVQCLVDPCDVAPECPEGECVANYCGGCRAEFYDDAGYAVCLPQSECEVDADCSEGSWCRQADPSDQSDPALVVMECVPFVGEGESCNGFTFSWAYERCAEGLVCDTPDRLPDVPGTCARACDSDSDCAEDQYCASDRVCAANGTCETDVDCSLPGNDYPRPACLGYGVCDTESNRCGWQCGAPNCGNLSGWDFGPCRAILGWGIIEGSCEQISGCSAEPFELFSSQAECLETCAAPACRDLVGADFGPCEAVLGYGVVEGRCVAVSGCDAGDQRLFDTESGCVSACGQGCYGDAECPAGTACNAAEVCLPPPGCNPGEVCPAVCYGQCVEAGLADGDAGPPNEQEAQCRSDADCMVTGCSGQVCASEPVFTTCEWRPEYACYDEAYTSCECFEGRCGWEATDELAECLEGAAGSEPVLR